MWKENFMRIFTSYRVGQLTYFEVAYDTQNDIYKINDMTHQTKKTFFYLSFNFR